MRASGLFMSSNAETCKSYFELKILMHTNYEDLTALDEFQREKEQLKTLMEERKRFLDQLNQEYENFINYVEERIQETDDEMSDTDDEEMETGLCPQIVQKFKKFTADDSFVDEQCVICMEDVEIDRNMMRLNCDGQHTFCQVCIEKWFDNHKTCPTCRHEF